MSYDILIKNGRVIDGAGNPWVRANVGIKNGKIAKMGRLTGATAAKELDVHDLMVCPGFIDPHSHSDRYIPFDPKAQSTIHQGITTFVGGQCGLSIAPINPENREPFLQLIGRSLPSEIKIDFPWNTFKEYLAESEKMGCSSNMVPLVGFSAIRIAGGPGYEDREPTPDEFEAMKGYVAEAMEAGAFGMSTGLIYTPQAFAKTEEVIELAKVAAQYGGLYFSHIRNEGAEIINAINECIEIVEKSGCIGGEIAHHKIAHKGHWGLSKETLRLIEDAYGRGLNVTADQYPYNRSQTSLITAIPPWAHVGGTSKLLERLEDPEDRARIKKEIEAGLTFWTNLVAAAGYEGIYLATVSTEKWKKMLGKSIAEITQIINAPDEFTTLCEILIEEEGSVGVTCQSMGEEDIKRIMQGRYCMIGSDGWAVAPTGILSFGKPHPRLYGTYPRVLRKYVREEGVLTWEDAIRRMTSFPAQKVGLWDRGLLREGCWADVVVFDPANVRDVATFEDPHQFATGIPYVLVNGTLVIENEQQTEELPGKVLRRPT